MASAFGDLPELLQEIAEVAGLAAAVAIAEAKGGSPAYFPAFPIDDHWLTKAVGHESAAKICDHFRNNHKRGIRLRIPMGPQNFYRRAQRRVIELRGGGQSIVETARAVGVSTRTVERWWARDKGDPRQGRLF